MESKIYREARLQVQKKIRFFNHLKFFLIANIFLFLISVGLFYSLWFLKITLVWGLGILGHYVDVFGLPGNGLLSNDWEEREIEKEAFLIQKRMEKIQKRDWESTEDDFELDKPLDLRTLRRNYDEADLV